MTKLNKLSNAKLKDNFDVSMTVTLSQMPPFPHSIHIPFLSGKLTRGNSAR